MKIRVISFMLFILCLYNLSARYYNPIIGRFITADTITPGGGADLQGLNRYSYCVNNPVKYVDPTGHEPMEQDHTAVSIRMYQPRESFFKSASLPSLSPVINKIREQHQNYIDSLSEDVSSAMKLRDNLQGIPYLNSLMQLAVVDKKQKFESVAHVNYDNVSSGQELLRFGVNVLVDAALSYGINYPLLKNGITANVIKQETNPYIDDFFNPITSGGNSFENIVDKNIGGIYISCNYKYKKESRVFSLYTSNIGTGDNNKMYFKKFLGQLEYSAKNQFGADVIDIHGSLIENTKLLNEKIWNRYGYDVVNKSYSSIDVTKSLK